MADIYRNIFVFFYSHNLLILALWYKLWHKIFHAYPSSRMGTHASSGGHPDKVPTDRMDIAKWL